MEFKVAFLWENSAPTVIATEVELKDAIREAKDRSGINTGLTYVVYREDNECEGDPPLMFVNGRMYVDVDRAAKSGMGMSFYADIKRGL